MEDNVRKELDTILNMVNNWKNDYLKYITGENDEYLLSDFLEELNTTYVFPFLNRLFEMEHIDRTEFNEFMITCYTHVDELQEAIDNAKP